MGGYATHSLGLSFLTCNMGTNIVPASKGCWKTEGLIHAEGREWYRTCFPQLLDANISRTIAAYLLPPRGHRDP